MFPPFFHRQFRESRFGCPLIARVISSEELGTMSKNNLRWITLVRGPIWGIHSLTLIISCSKLLVVFKGAKCSGVHSSYLQSSLIIKLNKKFGVGYANLQYA